MPWDLQSPENKNNTTEESMPKDINNKVVITQCVICGCYCKLNEYAERVTIKRTPSSVYEYGYACKGCCEKLDEDDYVAIDE